MNPYRTQSEPETELKPTPKFRIVREPYHFKEYSCRYIVQERVKFLFFWERWKEKSWAFSLSVALNEYRVMIQSRKPKAVVWNDVDGQLTSE